MGRRTNRTAAGVALLRALRGASGPGEPGLSERLRALPRLVSATLSGRYQGLTRGNLGVLAAALLYIVSPVDVVPEVLFPFVGLADDAVVASWLAGRLLGDTADFLRWERSADEAPGPADRAAGGSSERPDVVQGHVVR